MNSNNAIPTRALFTSWQTIPVRAADMDARRHVNNASYILYFEIARRAFFEAHEAFAGYEIQHQNPVLVTQTCTYRKALKYPATIDIGLGLRELRTRSFTFDCGIFHAGTEDLIAHGHTTHAWYHQTQDKATPIPNEIQTALNTLAPA